MAASSTLILDNVLSTEVYKHHRGLGPMLKFNRGCSFSYPPHLSRIVARYGKTFRLEAADDPVIFPSPSGTSEIESSIGFWYTQKNAATECVVVMISQSGRQPFEVRRQVNFIADKLAEQLARNRRLSAVYEFDGSEMVLKAC